MDKQHYQQKRESMKLCIYSDGRIVSVSVCVCDGFGRAPGGGGAAGFGRAPGPAGGSWGGGWERGEEEEEECEEEEEEA